MLNVVPISRICGVMVSIPASGVVDHGFMPVWLNQRLYIGIGCFSANHVALWRKSKDWLARN